MKHRAALVLSGLVVAAPALPSDPGPKDFAYTLPLAITPGSALYAFRVPAAVHARSVQPGLADVRVFNGDGQPVPHALRPPGAAPASAPMGKPLPLFPLKAAGPQAPSDSLELRIDRSGALVRVKPAATAAAPVPDRYVIDASRFEGDIAFLVIGLEKAEGEVFARVDVHASDDLRQWRPVTRGAPLVQMHFNGADLRELRIPIEGPRGRYLSLDAAGSDLPMRITRVEAVAPEGAGTRPRESVPISGSKGDRDGEYVYTTRGTYPADRVYVEPAADNTVMPFELDGRDSPSDPWMPVAHGTAYRLLHQGVKLESASFAVAGRWHRTYRLRFTSAPAPASAPVLRFEWTPAEIVFAAQGRPPFALAFGLAGAGDAALPLATLVPGLGTKSEVKPGPAIAGHESASAGDAATEARPDYRKWGVWGAMVLGALVVGGMALSLLRQRPQEK